MNTELRDKSVGGHELVPFLASSEAASSCCSGQLQTVLSWQVNGEEEGREGFGKSKCAVRSLQQAKHCRYRKVCVQSTNTVGSSEFISVS